MATPPRLVHLKCECGSDHWTIDSDFRGMGGIHDPPELRYDKRAYACPSCSQTRSGFMVLEQSPPEFLQQPHPLYPMSQSDFDHWASNLREHFPDVPQVQKLGKEFRPNTNVKRRWWKFLR